MMTDSSALAIRLHLRKPIEERFDASSIVPSQTMAMTRTEIENIPLRSERSRSVLGDWFTIEGERSQRLEFFGDCCRLDRVGDSMESGTFIIHGDIGTHVGARMKQGQLYVAGNCGSDGAQSMRGGRLVVLGDADCRFAGPSAGERKGVQGGELFVGGSVGADACRLMRRGTAMFAGDVDVRLAFNMIAGTIVVLGSVADDWCIGMKRGTILMSLPPNRPSQARCTIPRVHELSFLPILWKRIDAFLSESPLPIAFATPRSTKVHRRLGDRLVHGVGELLYPA